MAARPAYQKVCSDDQTLQLLFQRMMGLTASGAGARSGAGAAANTSAAAAAAAAMAAFAQTGSEPAAPPSPAEEKAARDEVCVCVFAVWLQSGCRQRVIGRRHGMSRARLMPCCV
jgi:hypothetical protein